MSQVNYSSFICERKLMSKQDVLVLIRCSKKTVQLTETMLSKLPTFPNIYWVETPNFYLENVWLVWKIDFCRISTHSH